MKELIVNDNKSPYNVYIDSSLDKFVTAMEENKIKSTSRIFLITDSNIYKLYTGLINSIKNTCNCSVYAMEPGENNKNYETVSRIYSFLVENNANRESVLISMGGGVVGDLVGFVASTYMRGIKYINIPTSLVAQVDSSIGGKVGYNFKEVKNMIGSYYNPAFVFIAVNFLKTLSREQILDGMGEIVKYAISSDINMFHYLEQNTKQILELENDKMLYLIKECLKVKKSIVEKDFYDSSIRNILNFGHTIGHAIETVSQKQISHGKAVALGILPALKISERKLSLPQDIYLRVSALYKKLGLPTACKVDNYKLFMYAINRDKKNDENIKFVLIKDIGKPEIKVSVSEKEIIEAVKTSISKEG